MINEFDTIRILPLIRNAVGRKALAKLLREDADIKTIGESAHSVRLAPLA